MTFKGFIVLMVVSTVAAWSSWLTVLFRINPFTDGGLGFLLFYLSLLLSLTGTITLLGVTVRGFLRSNEALFRHVSVSFRQAMLLSFLIVALLYSQAHQLLTWWNVLALVLACVMIEVFALTYSSRRRRD